MPHLDKRVKRLEVECRKLWKTIADLESAIASNTSLIASIEKEIDRIERYNAKESVWSQGMQTWSEAVTKELNSVDWTCLANICPNPPKPPGGTAHKVSTRARIKILDIDPPQPPPDWNTSVKQTKVAKNKK